jgi:hypothetical protein
MDHSSVTEYLIEYYEVISLNPVGPLLLYFFKFKNESAIYINYTSSFFFFVNFKREEKKMVYFFF